MSKIQSSTGEWLVSYNANNRPISFSQGNTRVECNYDYMGRQYLRKVYKNGSSSPSTNERYIHRGYLRLGALNMNNGADFYQALLWDPTEPQATRPLAMLNNDGTYYYGHDFNKNVTELFNANGNIVNHYDYRPYGALLWSEESIPNPIQYSSEIHDSELGLIYYNYRHYNPEDGRWLTRDPIQEQGGLNLYGFVGNNSLLWIDLLGLLTCHRNVIFTHFGDRASDKIGSRSNKLKKGDIAVGHYGKNNGNSNDKEWVVPFGTKGKIFPKHSAPMDVTVADHGAFDKIREKEAKKKNIPNTVHAPDWIDIWDPIKSKNQISDKGCIEFYLDDSVCECPKTYLKGPCPQPTQEEKP